VESHDVSIEGGCKTGSFVEPAAGTGAPRRSMVPYPMLWTVLLFGWIVSYADRTLTGPVVAWMIEKKAALIGNASNPAALGGGTRG
jgi:ACS family D-galactonate transporter-like MFS transporter